MAVGRHDDAYDSRSVGSSTDDACVTATIAPGRCSSSATTAARSERVGAESDGARVQWRIGGITCVCDEQKTDVTISSGDCAHEHRGDEVSKREPLSTGYVQRLGDRDIDVVGWRSVRE